MTFWFMHGEIRGGEYHKCIFVVLRNLLGVMVFTAAVCM
jgi:hypothetical protein